MPNPKLPKIITDARGTSRKDREPSPPPTDVMLSASAPDYLSATAKRAWQEIVPEILDLKICARIDIAALAMLCNEIAFYWDAEESCRKMISINNGKRKVDKDLLSLKRAGQKAYSNALSLMGRFAMTPTDRQRLIVPKAGKKEQGDYFDDAEEEE